MVILSKTALPPQKRQSTSQVGDVQWLYMSLVHMYYYKLGTSSSYPGSSPFFLGRSLGTRLVYSPVTRRGSDAFFMVKNHFVLRLSPQNKILVTFVRNPPTPPSLSRNGLVNQVEFLGLAHAFATV